VASHLTAARLWDLFDGPGPACADDAIHLIGPRQRRLTGVHLHRLRLDDRERTRHRSVPVTTPARTLFDLAVSLDADGLGRCTDDALRRRLVNLGDLERMFARHAGAGRRRLKPMRAVLADRVSGFDPGANDWEQRMDRLWEELGLPAAVRQHTIRVNGRRYRVDRAIPELRLAVEWVGTEFHSLNGRFARDRLRISDLVQAGWDVLEVTPHWAPKRLRATVLAKVAERRLIFPASPGGNS
jgi:very-short-patch-repair endonuclease